MVQELVDQLNKMAKKAVNGIHTALPGVVQSFDPATGLAVVKPTAKYKKPDGSTIEFPEISGVPVLFPQGAAQNVSIAYPVAAGDGCLLIVSEQSLDLWMYGRETESDLPFDLTNSIALVGLFAKAGPGAAAACAENAVVVTAGGTVFKVTPGGVSVTGGLTVSGNLTVGGSVNASGNVTGGGISLTGHTHTGVHGETSGPH